LLIIYPGQKSYNPCYESSNNSTLIKNSTFYNNNAYNGGAVYSRDEVLTVINCSFVADSASSSGGGIYRISSSNTDLQIILSDTALVNNAVILNDTVVFNYNIGVVNIDPADSLVISTTGEFMVSSTGVSSDYYDSLVFKGDSKALIIETIYIRYVAGDFGVAGNKVNNTIADTTVEVTVSLDVNATLPISANNTVLITEGTHYVFQASDYAFESLLPNTLAAVIIYATETEGDLEYNGTDVKEGDRITDINLLQYAPYGEEYGLDYTDFYYKVQDNEGYVSDDYYVMTIHVNDIPRSDSITVTTTENTDYTFSSSDITITNDVGSAIVVISTLETAGDLEYDGTDVTVGTECDDLSKLVFKPEENQSGDGYASFGVKLVDSYGEESEDYIVTINVEPEYESGIDLMERNGITVYPNPAVDHVVLCVEDMSLPVSMSLKDITGKTVTIKEYHEKENTIDVSGLASGVYFIEISGSEETVVRKIIKE